MTMLRRERIRFCHLLAQFGDLRVASTASRHAEFGRYRTGHNRYGARAVYGLRPTTIRFWAKLAAAAGPGYLIAVGYMDPGNWATDIAGGSQFGYRAAVRHR